MFKLLSFLGAAVQSLHAKMTNPRASCWEIVCPKGKFEALRSYERFWAILTLSRIVNALSFCHVSGTEGGCGDTPSVRRQRSNAFLFASSVLYEGLEVAETLGRHFRDLNSFRNGFAILMAERETDQVRRKFFIT